MTTTTFSRCAKPVCIGLWGLFILNACRPARPIVLLDKDDNFYFQDKRTERIISGPYHWIWQPDAGKPLPKKSLKPGQDSTKLNPWLLNTWGKRTVRAFIFDFSPDKLAQGVFRYTVDDTLVGFANRRGQIMIPARFTIAFPFSQGRSIVGMGNHQEPLCPDDSEHPVWRGGKWGMINRRGQTVIPIEYDAFNPVKEHENWIEVIKGKESFLMTRRGKRLSPRPYQTWNHPCDTTRNRGANWEDDSWGGDKSLE